MKGRKPKPAALRTLHHTPTRAHHHDVAPDPDAAPVDLAAIGPPAGLVAAERAYWHQFAPLLAGAKVLIPADVETLADYCRACAAVDDRGRRLRTAFKRRTLDVALVRLLDAQARGWMEKKMKLAGELGLTAIARTRVAWTGHAAVIDPAKRPQSRLAQLQQEALALRRPLAVAP